MCYTFLEKKQIVVNINQINFTYKQKVLNLIIFLILEKQTFKNFS